jgi:hypothetical protein
VIIFAFLSRYGCGDSAGVRAVPDFAYSIHVPWRRHSVMAR